MWSEGRDLTNCAKHSRARRVCKICADLKESERKRKKKWKNINKDGKEQTNKVKNTLDDPWRESWATLDIEWSGKLFASVLFSCSLLYAIRT